VTFGPIAIVGRACLLPGAHTPEELWRVVMEKRIVLHPIPDSRWRADRRRMLSSGACATDVGGVVEGFEAIWNPARFSVDADLLEDLDPVVHWLLHTGREALLDAGITDPAAQRIGVVSGNLAYPTEALVDFAQSVYLPDVAAKKRGPMNRFSSGFPVHLMCSALGLSAGGYGIDAACASSLYAIKLASDWLHSGRADVMLAGAVNRCDGLIIHSGFTALRALSLSGQSRPFHRDADGLVPAEGAAFVVLKRLADAIVADDRILAVIRGIGLSNDGRSGGILTPSSEGQIRAMKAAYEQSGIDPADIGFVECHATGTRVGDATELQSMASVFEGAQDVPVGSLKSNIGHSITVSGAAGLIRVIEAMQAGIRPATTGTGPLTGALDGTPLRVLREHEPWQTQRILRAAVSSFGFGGNNAHLLVEQYVPGTRYSAACATPREQVAVVALAARAGDGDGTEDFISDLLVGNRPAGHSAERIRVPSDGLVFPPRDLARALVQQTALLGVAGEALSQAAVPHPDRTAVFIGMQCDAEATRSVIRLALPDLLRQGMDVAAAEAAMDEPMDAARVVGCMPNMTANRINRQFSLGGPGFSVTAEELSGVRALEIAIEQVATFQIDAAVAGASDFCGEPVHAAATSVRPGDAVCVVVVKRVSDAQRDGDRILATLEHRSAEMPGRDGADLAQRVRDCFGVAHAAQGFLNVAAAVVAMDRTALCGAVPFLPGEERRCISMTTDATGGQSAAMHVIEPERSPSSVRRGLFVGDVPDIHLYSGRDLAELRESLDGATDRKPADCRLAIVATPRELHERIAQARSFIEENPHGKTPPDGIFFQPDRMEREIAYVFTGAAAAYPGMGRDLLLAFPELAEQFAADCRVDVQRYAGWIYGDCSNPSDFEQLCGSTLLCQAHARFTLGILGLKPQAAIGLSSGETNALFALGAWHRVGEFVREIEDCGLYTRVLAGRADALGGRRWTHYRISAPEREVSEAVRDESLVFVIIVNAPDDVMIGGESWACERVARRFGSRATPLPLQLAVHCPAVQPAADLWRRLHFRPTDQPSGIRFYTNARGASYDLTSESVADALTIQVLNTVDFPRTILRAWNDGVRIFVEHGPRNQCTQFIRAILNGRPHLAVSLDANGRSSLRQAMAAAAELWCAGAPVDIAGLHVQPAITTKPHAFLTFQAHPPPLRLTRDSADEEVFVMTPAPRLAPLLESFALPRINAPLHRTALAMHAKMTEAHQLHIAELARMHASFLASERRLLSLLSHRNGSPRPRPEPVRPRRSFSRADLEKLATGRISDVFGEVFRAQDSFARQVRMPQPPLLLADRVVDLIGEPNSMGRGRIVTETDIRPDSWYLHQGNMPAGMAVESGQADLLLISWLGIDQFNKSERVYRLLGCELTFHNSLPKAGDTLRYEIQVDGHTTHGDVRMFSFHYDCFVGTELMLTVRHGQAGFFTDRELAGSEGVLWSAETARPTPTASARLDPPVLLTTRRMFDASHVRAFAEGRMAECFGETFSRAHSHTRSPRIQTGRMLLLRTVEDFDPAGGPWGRGFLRAEYPISPDDWFFEGHFKNDPCMPGTLMFEGCLQAMAFYMCALGFGLERDGWRFTPIPEETYHLRCRGQVLPSLGTLTYEVFVDEIDGRSEPVLYADVLCRLDSLKIFHCRRLGLRMAPGWPLEEVHSQPSANVPFDQQSLMTCALGRPSHAFGPDFAIFDGPLRIPRLPGPPYHFMSRVTRASKGSPVTGAVAEAEYYVPADEAAWFFAENGSPVMPVSVLVEVLLQPCGWLASYAGTWLDARQDIFFRNLDGSGVFHAEVTPRSGVLRTSVTLTSCSPAGAMSITAFNIVCRARDQLVFEGTAVFGHFPADALHNQTGLPPAPEELEWMAAASNATVSVGDFDSAPRLGRGKLQMIDRISCFWPEGGRAHLGVLRAEKDVDPKDWFFKAHFFTDPVQPGSLGLEAAIESLQSYLLLCRRHAGMRNPRFEPVGIGMPVSWTYRGQVLPHNRLVTVLLQVLEVSEHRGSISASAEASFWVDGTKIYSIPHLGMRLIDDVAAESLNAADTEVLDPAINVWLRDHCPTSTIPVLPMMSVLDRLALAAAQSTPNDRVIEIRDARLNGWIAFDRGPRRFKTEAVGKGSGNVDVTLSVWRDASHAEMSRYDVIATAHVQLDDRYPDPPLRMPPLTGADLVHDPPALDIYESGELFHGPQFHFLKKMWRSGEGSSFLLEAAAGAVPAGFLDQGLLDGIAHGIPHENLRLWSERIAIDQVGYPSRVIRLSLFSECPADRKSECEVRFDGFDRDDLRFPKFRAQLIRDGRVWAEMELVYALFNKGPLGMVPGRQRRRFLRDRNYVPGMIVGEHTAGATRVSDADLSSTDWLPGTVEYAFGIAETDRLAGLAIRQHISQKAAVHPAAVDVASDFRSAQCARFPITIFPLKTDRTGHDVTVRDDGSPRIQCDIVRHVWEKLSGIGEWPVLDLHVALIERFVRRVELDDPSGFAALRGRPVLYVANHQCYMESVLFNALFSALSETPIKTIAKKEQRQRWIGQLIDIASRYPGARHPVPILYFDRHDASSFFTVLENFRSAMKDSTFSLMVHVDGTRATSSRARTSQVSAILLDFALEMNLPIVPVRFIGGLPADPVISRLEYPFQYGQQDIRAGSPLSADTLRALPLVERSRLVVNAINALAPENEFPLPPHPGWPCSEPSVLLESLRFASHLCGESRMVLEAAKGDLTPVTATQSRSGVWIDELAAFLRNVVM
jgi:acyl transferase domain-containing protein/3-hydroxymyristoyl/3-hydroxydecanoyl-(acyl carrier protein) dehydratase